MDKVVSLQKFSRMNGFTHGDRTSHTNSGDAFLTDTWSNNEFPHSLSAPQPNSRYFWVPPRTGHSFRRTSATLLVDGGGDLTHLTDLKRHGGWKSSTVAEGYINESLHHKQEIHKKITKSIALKTINDGITDKNNYQIKSSSAP